MQAVRPSKQMGGARGGSSYGSRLFRAVHRRRWLIALGFLLFLVAIVVAVLIAAVVVPEWYRPATIDYGKLPSDKRELVRLIDDISAALNSGKSISIEVSDDQVNRWIAARGELWPDADIDLGPLDAPQVDFFGGRARLAATAIHEGYRGIVWVSCGVLICDGDVRLGCGEIHLGALPIPPGWLRDRLPGSIGRDRVSSDERGLVLATENAFTWPNGKCPYRICEVVFTEGKASITLEALRHGSRGTSDRSSRAHP